MHPRDQWFRIYVYTPGVAGPVLVGDPPKEGEPDTRKIEAGWIELPKWGPESETEHLVHPDAYQPDVRLRVQHHRQAMKQGFNIAACGHVHDPRMRFVETEGKPKKPCGGCVKATEAAKEEHARALEVLVANAEAKKRSLKAAVPELGAAVVPGLPEADKVDP